MSHPFLHVRWKLEEWHENRSASEADRTRDVLVERRILECMAVDGMSQRDAREDIGCSRAEMARGSATICEVFPFCESWLEAHAGRLRAGEHPGTPLPTFYSRGADGATSSRRENLSRRKLKAPADGIWHKGTDSP